MSQAAEAYKGQIIEGRYRVIGRIADGGMATVYEALDQRLDRHVAIKIMHTQLAQGPHRAQFEERFRREATSAAAIANPHIVQVYDTGQVDGLDYLVMEYVHGVNLRHEMGTKGTFSVRETIRVVSEVLDGLASAHETEAALVCSLPLASNNRKNLHKPHIIR
ncbi:protein kinase domain-containing protein, partial [Bifidobacterium aemilianum]|uniref:protein kinase domain-containing protein n=1 Tax=Bifidobacterium aemilianum TaxID=2493120 RepID=UPI00102B3D4B